MQVSGGIRDVRYAFARRFAGLARERGIDSEHLLVLGHSGSTSSHAYDSGAARVSDPSRSLTTDQPTTVSGSKQHRTTIVVPGLLGNSVSALVAPLMCAREQLSVKGYDIEVAWVNGRAGCSRNARPLRDQVLHAANESGSPVNLVGYSKGCADALHMLGEYPQTHESVSSLVSLAGVVHGTPIARNPPLWLRMLLQYLPVPGVPFGDGRAIVDLSRKVRRKWILENPLPPQIRLASVIAVPQRHRVSRILRRAYDGLSEISSANDSQVIDNDALLPGSELLAVVDADHWAIALPIAERMPRLANLLVDQNRFPRDVLLQSIIDHLAESPETGINPDTVPDVDTPQRTSADAVD